MKNILTGLMIAALGAASAQAAGTRYIVTFDAKANQADREKALGALDLTASKHIATNGDTDEEVSMAIVELPKGQTLETEVGKAICKDPQKCSIALRRIVRIEKDQRVKWIKNSGVSFQAAPMPSFEGAMAGFNMPKASQFVQNPLASQLAAQRPELTWGAGRVQAPAAWATCETEKKKTCEGAGVKVAVIDTGIDYTHPELAGKVDGGYSAITKTSNPADYRDDQGHGTHVAGTIAAKKDGKGVVGVAPQARLYAVKVLDADGSGNLSDVIEGIVWAAVNKMDVANMSLGAPIDSEAMKRAVRFARGSGVVIVAAAGNSGGSVGFPGAYEDVIAVAASDSKDKLAQFSSRGPEVDLIAPGVDILSSRLGGGFASYSGTSMAAPHVAGLAAISVAQGYVGLGGPDGVMEQLLKSSEGHELVGGYKMPDAGKLAR